MNVVESTPPAVRQGDDVVIGVGVRSAIGLNAMQTVIGLRAEHLRIKETPFVDKNGDTISICKASWLPDTLTGLPRLTALAVPAILEATAAWRRASEARLGYAPPLPLVMAVPERVSFRPSSHHKHQEFLQDFANAAQHCIDPAGTKIVSGGRASGVLAIQKALTLLATGAEAVIVGGVDSYFDADELERLDAQLRVHGLETENGFIPGEAAAFLLLAPRRRSGSCTRYASILGHAHEEEPRPYGHPEPCQSLGMTLALRNAASSVGESRSVGWQITDVVNERHRVDEWEYARARAFQLFTDDVTHEQPLLSCGDVGSASVPLFVSIATLRWATGCGVGDTAMIAVHSDGPERGALLIAREAP